jgi:aminodeoxyfutalosine deaminase
MMSLRDFVAAMPKVELHVHLEGSIRPATLLALAQRNGVSLPADDLDGLRAFYRFTDFAHFIQVYVLVTSCLKSAADFALIAYEFGAEMARQNIHYAEVTFTPYTSVALTGLPFSEILAGLNDGRGRAADEFGVEFAWVLDIVRDDPDSSLQVATWAAGSTEQGVVALGLGGTERGHPPEGFSAAFALAREAGLHSVPHAGEMAGPESIWGALRALGAERIGHGVRCIEDPALVAYLAEHQVPLEVCPTSNLCLGVYPSYAQHPFPELWEQGLYLTVNSDDPPMFNTDLIGEYRAVSEHMGLDAGSLEVLSLNALRASFLPSSRKEEMEAAFRREFRELRHRLLSRETSDPARRAA